MSLSKFKVNDEILEQELIESLLFENIEDFEEEPIPKKSRCSKIPVDYWNTTWGLWMKNPLINNPNSKIAKIFMVRFRVPWILFKEKILPMCVKDNIFDLTYDSLKGVPIEFKILLSLRILGRGNVYDDINELSSVPVSSLQKNFHTFVKRFALLYYDEFIRCPGEASLKERLAHYAALGLGGAMGSVDCTRIWWNHCPKWLRNFCIGKEGFPALAFLLICDHNRQIIHVSRNAYLGALNDINIAKIDPYIIDLMEGKFQHVEFTLLKPDGTRVQCYGAYLISDNGFLQNSVFIDPFKARYSQSEIFWSEWLESVRKDVECVFGILKSRFRILLLRMGQHQATTIRDIFITCCILHNMINMYNDAIANPIYEIDPNISEEIFLAWEPSHHGSWDEFVKGHNINVSTHNLKVRDLVDAEARLVNFKESDEDNFLSMALFSDVSQASQVTNFSPHQNDDIEDTDVLDDIHVEDPELLLDSLLPHLRTIEEQDEGSTSIDPRVTQQRKILLNRIFGKTVARNTHLLQLVNPDHDYDLINNAPSLLGMINSLPRTKKDNQRN